MRPLILSVLLFVGAPLSASAGPLWLAFPDANGWSYPTYLGSDGFHLDWDKAGDWWLFRDLTIVRTGTGPLHQRIDAPIISMTILNPDATLYEFGAGTISVDFTIPTPHGLEANWFRGATLPFSFVTFNEDHPYLFAETFIWSIYFGGRFSPGVASAFGLSSDLAGGDLYALVEQIDGEPGDAAREATSSLYVSINTVPEPATGLVLLLGAGGVAFRRRWRP